MIIIQETAMLKAKKELQNIEQDIRRETIEGDRIDVVEENSWEPMLNLRRLMFTGHAFAPRTAYCPMSC